MRHSLHEKRFKHYIRKHLRSKKKNIFTALNTPDTTTTLKTYPLAYQESRKNLQASKADKATLIQLVVKRNKHIEMWCLSKEIPGRTREPKINNTKNVTVPYILDYELKRISTVNQERGHKSQTRKLIMANSTLQTKQFHDLQSLCSCFYIINRSFIFC